MVRPFKHSSTVKVWFDLLSLVRPFKFGATGYEKKVRDRDILLENFRNEITFWTHMAIDVAPGAMYRWATKIPNIWRRPPKKLYDVKRVFRPVI